MKKFLFKIWFFYYIYLLLYRINILKYFIYIKKYIYFIYYIMIIQYIKYIYIFFKKKVLKKVQIVNNFLQKGYKLKNLGIYKLNLYNIDNYNIDNYNIKKKKNFIFLIRFKRKNLYLTLLNNEGNVLCKTNIGSCGFKKKVKFTGYAIKQTSSFFLGKIIKSLIYNVYNTYYIQNLKKKKKKRIKNKLVSIYNKVVIATWNKIAFVKKKKKKYNFESLYITRKKKRRRKIKNLKSLIKKKRTIKKFKSIVFCNFYELNYRNYHKYFQNRLKKKLKITLRIKSNLKFWGFRFAINGLSKQFYWFRNLEIRFPIPHSTSLRLRKKRRI